MYPRVILFDMDGVLVDSKNSWYHAVNSIFKSRRGEDLSEKEFIEKYWGYDLWYIFDEADIDMEVPLFCNNIYVGYTEKIEIYEDTVETLKALDDYGKVVITNTPVDCTKEILKEFGIDRYFDAVVTSTDVENGKPDPEIIYNACEKMNVGTEDAVVVGDHEVDVKAGKRAGCTVIGKGVQGDHKIDRLSELIEVIEKMRDDK